MELREESKETLAKSLRRISFLHGLLMAMPLSFSDMHMNNKINGQIHFHISLTLRLTGTNKRIPKTEQYEI